jgi:cyclophilin family peptidyl-prolyl cis-trans isomerase/HEAT repeat protein
VIPYLNPIALKYINIIWVIIVVATVGCVPPTEEVITEVNLNYSSPELQKAYNYLDRQYIDSLLQFTNNPDPSLRILVANGIASIKDAQGIDSLKVLLKDPIVRVRGAAAYALGQTGSPDVVPFLLDAFKEKDTIEVNSTVNANILEAVGKTGDVTLLRSLATVSTYRETDTLLLLGQTRAIYRYGLRGITSPEGTDLMVEYVTDMKYPRDVRLMAAHYLQRVRGISIEDYKFRLAETFAKEEDVYIKMALATALSKTTDRGIMDVLINEIKVETDYRVKVNTLKALGSYPYIRVIDVILSTLNDPNIHVSTTAANFLINNGNSADATLYRGFLQDTMDWRIKTKVYAAILNNIPAYYTRTKAIYRNDLTKIYEKAEDPYEKAAIIDALSYDPLNYKLITELGFEGEDVQKTAAMSGLGRILVNEDFNRIFRGGVRRVRAEILDLMKAGIATGDAGMIAVAGEIIQNADQNLMGLLEDYSFLEEAASKLELPREVESYNAIQAAIAHIKGETYEQNPPEYNHPIQWSILNSISDSATVNIRTTKGVIKVQMYKKLTPGTVSNFVELINQGFYNQKVFHRVVPNFVIQTGCPRGDGYGSQNYSIRSELPQLYYDDQGYIGMASAGPHTESTQWFITHSPTPHLDGNYTIFGKVIDGMDVVHDITVGDKIQDIIISD